MLGQSSQILAGLRHAAAFVADSGHSVARLRQQDGKRQWLGRVRKPANICSSELLLSPL